MQLLHDSIWQFIGVLISLIGVIVSTVLFFKQRSRKKIYWEIDSNIPILSIEEEEVDVLYKGKSVPDMRRVVLRIWNSGSTHILSNDFATSIKFEFGEKAEVLNARILKMIPSAINDSLLWDSNYVILQPLLLNSDDSITLKVLVAKFNGEINGNARIVGGIFRLNKPKMTKIKAILITMQVILG
jgi:hypothetical protein